MPPGSPDIHEHAHIYIDGDAAADLLCAQPANAAKPWQTLSGCRLVEHWRNDGDSLRVLWNDGELTVRLYFADAPEADTRF